MCTIKDNVHQGLLDTQCNVEETLILFFCAKHQAFWKPHQFFFSLAASFLFYFSSSDDFVLLLIPFNLQAIEFTPRLLFFAMLRNLHLSLLGVSFLSWILNVYWLYCWHFDICSYCRFLTHLLELQVTYTWTYAFEITMYHFTTVVIYNCRMQFYIGSVWLPRSWECLWILQLLFVFLFFPLSFHSQVLLQCFFWSWVIMWMEALSWGWGLNAIGVAELVELDGPFVKLRLTGRFWHERSMVLARVANYLRKRIPVSYHFPVGFFGGEGNPLFNCCLTTIQGFIFYFNLPAVNFGDCCSWNFTTHLLCDFQKSVCLFAQDFEQIVICLVSLHPPSGAADEVSG